MKYVFEDKRLHILTRLSVIFIVAPYMLASGIKYKDNVLKSLAVILILFDIFSVFSPRDDLQIHQSARLAALFIQAPYMIYAAYRYKDTPLGILGAATLGADSYTYYLGRLKSQ